MAEGNVRRGEVYLVDFPAHGSALGKRRPAVVVQNDTGNRFAAETIVAAVRDPHGGVPLPVFAAVAQGQGGLAKDSVVDTGFLFTLPTTRLGTRLGALSPSVMREVDRALLCSLALTGAR